MSKPEVIKIDEVEYVRRGSEVIHGTEDIRIVVLQRGWVAVGKYSIDGENAKLTNASIIRIWGTTKGLGEIAINGPTPKTVLDKCPDISFHILTTIFTINCVRTAWESKLI